MQLESYLVKYNVNNTQSQATLHLYSNSESQAISKLKQKGSVSQDSVVIILSIQKR